MSLTMLLQMILEGANISLLDDNKTRDIAIGLSQLVKFNAIKRKLEQSVLHVRHKNSQKTHLTVYIGFDIHSKIRKKVWRISFHHMNFAFHLIVSTKFNQLSLKTYANNIVLKKQCVRTHYFKIFLPQRLLITLTIMRHHAHHLVIFMGQASQCFNITII